MRIKLMLLTAFGTLAFGIAPVAAQTTHTPSGLWICPQQYQGQTLNVYNWTTYIAEDTISNFERMCGVTVNYNTYASDTDMVDELRAGDTGQYDVVVPTDPTVAVMIGENLLAPINLNNIPNFANITTRFKNPPYDPDNTYTVPYQWGTIGLGYNHDTVGKDLTSWNDMLTSDKKVAWLDEPRPMLGLALKMLGDDPNTSDTTQIEAAGQYLIDHSKNVTAIAPDNGQDLLAAGQADIVVEYSGDIFQVINDCACNKFRYDIPSEGSVIWVDNLAMPRNAKNKALAQVFMDYILTAQPGADISNFTSYATPNQAAIDEGLIDSTSLHNPAIYPDEALQSKLFFVQSSTDLEQKYATVWDKVKKAVGK